MKTSRRIEKKISRMKVGLTFRYSELGVSRSEYPAATKAMERFIHKGMIKRISKGVFYKPEQTVFGELRPGESELIKLYLFENGKRIAYITGTSLYNQMGLTTQIPKTLKIASRARRVSTEIGGIRLKPIKSYADVTKENYKILEILDALKDFKIIPDLDEKSAILLLQSKLQGLNPKNFSRIVKYGLKYPPRTRAFLGALISDLHLKEGIESLKKSLNPLTIYRLGIGPDALPSVSNWNIC